MRIFSLTVAVVAVMGWLSSVQADSFGTPGNEFTIEFVTVGNVNNAHDTGGGGGSYSSPFGGVSYEYRIGTHEISQDAITKATASGMTSVTAGAHTGNEPAAAVTWYEAAAFVNWLNTSTGHQPAYDLNAGATALTLWSSGEAWQAGGENLYRHKNAYYFLPNEDEWYKAAFHKNDGVTANYWDYATGSNTAPAQSSTGGTAAGSAVYDGVELGGPSDPADVDMAGGLSPYGTMGQNGNVHEWLETASDGANDSPTEFRVYRGGQWPLGEDFLRSSFSGSSDPSTPNNSVGFRVASIVESVASSPDNSAAKALLNKKIKKLRKKIKKARKKNKTAKVRRLSKQLKRLNKRLRRL